MGGIQSLYRNMPINAKQNYRGQRESAPSHWPLHKNQTTCLFVMMTKLSVHIHIGSFSVLLMSTHGNAILLEENTISQTDVGVGVTDKKWTNIF